jgi:acetyl-CoA synthetase
MGEWAWAAGICPLLGPWRMGAVQAVYQREGGFDPHKRLDFLSRHGVGNVFGTPTAIRSMMSIADAGTRYPQKFRIVCSAGEPLNPEAIRWFREQYGITVLDYYGLTESYPLCASYPFMEVREGSMGKPMPGWEVAILDDDERPVAAGERGEICLKARSNPDYPLGYWNRSPRQDQADRVRPRRGGAGEAAVIHLATVGSGDVRSRCQRRSFDSRSRSSATFCDRTSSASTLES